MSSIRDVARKAGVSISTVSRVTNGLIPVDPRTRKKVELAIRRLDYRPNLLAKGLRVKSGRLIGLVVPDIVHHHAFVQLINYVQACAYAREYDLVLGNNLNNPDIEEYFINSLIRRHVDGIIFSRVSDESRVVRLLTDKNVPMVVVDRALEDESIPSVTVDNYAAGRIAADHLAGLGHRRIGCITGPLNIALCRERLRAFQETLRDRGIALSAHDEFESDFSFEGGIRGASELVGRADRVTAIWAQNDRMAAGALKCLLGRHLRVPEDVSLMGMDDIDTAALITPSLTTIRQPFEEMSRRAVEIILDRSTRDRTAGLKIVLEPSLVVRESTREVLA